MTDVVRRQQDAGIDVPGDGEFGKAMGHRVNYGAWWSYSFQRLGGLEPGTSGSTTCRPRRSEPGNVVLTSFADRRDRERFAAAYADPDSGIPRRRPRPAAWPQSASGPSPTSVTMRSRADIAQLQGGAGDGGRRRRLHDRRRAGQRAPHRATSHYKTDEEFLFACADAMREEYKAIIDAGLILQLDDPVASPRTGTCQSRSRPSSDYQRSR